MWSVYACLCTAVTVRTQNTLNRNLFAVYGPFPLGGFVSDIHRRKKQGAHGKCDTGAGGKRAFEFYCGYYYPHLSPRKRSLGCSAIPNYCIRLRKLVVDDRSPQRLRIASIERARDGGKTWGRVLVRRPTTSQPVSRSRYTARNHFHIASLLRVLSVI